MSVTTTADEKLDVVRDYVSCAYKEILETLNPETWGHNDFNDEYINKLHKAAMGLLEIKRLIG